MLRSNKDIKDYILMRMDELNLTADDIVREARTYRLKITNSSFSRWINAEKYQEGILTQKQILWLCKRYGVSVLIVISLDKDFDTVKAAGVAEKFIQTFNTKY